MAHRKTKPTRRAATPHPRRSRSAHTAAAARRRRADFAVPARTSSLKMLVSVEQEDLEWLEVTVGTLKSTRRGTTKSEIVRAGLKLLMEKRLDELKELIRHLY